MRRSLAHMRQHGQPEPEHRSHDDLNKLSDLPVAQQLCAATVMPTTDERSLDDCRQRLSSLNRPVVLIEGFLVFYDAEVDANYDVRILLRERREVLKTRREERASYVRRSVPCKLTVKVTAGT